MSMGVFLSGHKSIDKLFYTIYTILSPILASVSLSKVANTCSRPISS